MLARWVAAWLGGVVMAGSVQAGFIVTGYPPASWGAADAAIGLAHYTVENFESTTLNPNLRVGCESPAGNLTPTSTLPNTFNPTNDPFGAAFQAGVWDGAGCLINTRDNQSHPDGESQHWGTMILEFPTPAKSVGFSLQRLNHDLRLFINGAELGGLAALSGLATDGQRQGYVRIDATGPDAIAQIRLANTGDAAGWVIDHLAFTTNPPPFRLTGFDPAHWGTDDWALGVAGWFVEDFEQTNLAPHLLIGCETAAGNSPLAGTLPNVFNPTNDPFGNAFHGAPWTGSAGLLNTRDNQSHSYAETAAWGALVLQFTVPMRAVGFSVQQMESDTRLIINGGDYGSLTRLAGLAAGSGRQGYVRIEATGTNTITALKLDNAPGDGFVLDHLTYAPGLPLPLTQWEAAQGGNDHWYAAVLVGPNGINFNQASNAAVSLQGHLATLHSEAENTFVLGLINDPAFWFVDGANNGEGPWIGGWQPVGSPEPAGGWRWVTDEPWTYTRWAPGEPNNSGGGEDRICFFGPGSLMGTVWNDYPQLALVRGYLVEWETYPAAPVFTGVTSLAVPLGEPLAHSITFSGQPTGLTASGLPDGITFDPARARLSGTATNTGTFPIQVTAANPLGVTTQTIILTVQPRPRPAPPGLLAWWTGDNTAEDCVGFFHGQLRNGATFAPGKVGPAFSLDGVDDFVEMPNVVTSNGAFSFAFWMKAASFTHARYMGALCQENDSQVRSEYRGWFYYTGADAGFHSLGLQGFWTDNSVLEGRTVQALQPGVWYHVVSTYDGAKLRQYLNGALCNEVSYSGKAIGNPWSLRLGKLTAFPSSGHVTTYFHGLLDEIMFFNRALATNEIAEIFAADSGGIERPGLLPPASLAAWWPGDGHARDVIGWNHGWLVGGTQFTNGLVNEAFVFDSDEDRVLIPHNETLNVSSNGFTVEFWMKADKNQPQDAAALIDKSHGFTDFTGWAFHVWRADGRLSFGIGDGSTFPPLYSASDVLDDAWHHVAGVWDRTNWLIYVDGALEGALTRPTVANNTRPLLFGCAWGDGTPQRFYRGLLDEVALYPRALSAAEIASVAAAGARGRQKPACVAPPDDLVLWLPGEGDAKDSASGLNGALSAGVSFTEGRVGRAFRFVDSPDSYVTLPNSPLWLPANNQLSIAAWVKPDFTVTGDKTDTILSKRDGCGTFSYHFGVMKGHRGITGPIYFGLSSPSGQTPDSTGVVPDDGQFHHVAVTFNGNAASNNIRFYIDGQPAGVAHGPQIIPVTTAPPVIGKHAECGYYSSADMDEITFFQRALSAQEIAALYTAGSAGLCQSGAPAAPPTGQVAWWRAEDDARDVFGDHHGTLQNGAGFSDGVAGAGFAFDGVDEGVIVPHAEALNVSANGFTVEFWMRGDKNQADSQYCVIEKSHGWADSTGWAVQGDTSSGRLGFLLGAGGGGSVNFVGAGSVVNVLDGQFHHIAGTWDGAAIRFYVDGQLQETTAFTTPVNNTRPLNLGFTWGGGTTQRFFKGTVDEVSVYQRALSVGEIRAIVAAGGAGKQPPECAPPPAGLVGWWPGDDHARDLAPGGMHGALQGNATYAPGRVGQAFQFQGGTDSVLVAAPIVRLTNQFTLAAWVNPATHAHEPGSAPGRAIISRVGGAGGNNGYQLFLNNGRLIGQFNTPTTAWGSYSITSPVALPTNAWSHVAWTYDQSAMRLYINGLLVATKEIGLQTLANTTSNLRISRDDNGNAPFHGLIDEVVICTRALTDHELGALYAAGSLGLCRPQCAPPPEGLIHWFRGDNQTTDAITGLGGVLEGGAAFAAGRVGQAFRFDGVNDLVSYTDFPNLGTNSFSVAFWYRAETTSAAAGMMKLINKGMTRYGTPANAGFHVRLESSKLAFSLGDASGRVSITSSEPTVGVWHHVVGTLDRSNRLARLYVDGALAAQTNYTTLGSIDTDIRFAIGALDRRPGSSALAEFFQGLIDEVLFFDRPLGADEAAWLHAAGDAGLCPTFSFDMTAAFSITRGNPNGTWSYGWTPTDFSTFHLDTYAAQQALGPAWWRAADVAPQVWKNTSSGTAYGVPSGWLSLHPGGGGIPSLIRWTAPAAGIARAVGQFLPGDSGAMQVAVRLHGQPWWNATDAGSFDLSAPVAAGDTIDFAVYGGYMFGNTPVEANITLALTDAFPPVILTHPTNQVVTATRDVTLAVSAFGSEPLHYQWFFTNAPLAGATEATLALPWVTTNQAGAYFAVVSNFLGSVTSQVAVLTVLPDTEGPAVLAFTPTGPLNTNVSRLTVRFSERINTNTFTRADVAVLAPGGALDPAGFTLQPLAPFDHTAFEILLPPQSAEGLYTVQIGPDIADLAGNPMAAAFTAQFTLDKTGPAVTGVIPSGVVSNTITAFEVSLDSPYAPASVSAGDVTVSGPDAPGVQGVNTLDATRFRVTLTGPLPQGEFTITIGPDITDLAGNPMAAPFNTQLTVFLPDLTASGIIAPATAPVGQPFNLTWTVTNQGPGNVTAAWKSRVQLATNSAGAGAVTLGTFTATNLLGATAALSQTGLVILPATAAGERWLVVTVDADNAILENNETNNIVISSTPITLLAPDLALAGLSVPASAQFGRPVNVQWAVTNVGTAPAAAVWSDRLYLSSASNSLAGATLLDTVTPQVSPLPPGDGYTRANQVTLPLTAESVPGTFWLVAVTDFQDVQPEASEANNLRSALISLALPPLPDLEVTEIVAPGFVLPGHPFELSWGITNSGPAAAAGPWSETIIVTNADTGLQALARFAFGDDLPPGGFLARTQVVTIPLDGPAGGVHLGVLVDSRREVIEATEGNNLTWATNRTGVPLSLSLQLAADEVLEGAPEPVAATLTRNGSRAGALTTVLSNSAPTELFAPGEVTIPAGEAAVHFNVSALPDGMVDGPQTVRLTATASNYAPALVQIVVLDANLPQLHLVLATNVVREGRTLRACVVCEPVARDAVVVSLESSAPDQLLPPATVVVPAGEAVAEFDILALDDTLIEPETAYNVHASAPWFIGAETTVLVQDDDVPLVTLTLAEPVISENAGPQATLATLTRDPVTPRSVVVELTSSDPATARVPARVTLPANTASTTFAVAAVDDTVLNGTRTVTLGGHVLATEPAVPVASLPPVTLTVTDDEGPALRVVVAQKLLQEGLNPATTVTVSRNTPATNALPVQLFSSNPGEATVPASAVIPLGQASVSVPLATVADGVTDGSQQVVITASAPGYADGQDTVTVTDTDRPDLFIASLTLPESGETESYVNVSYRVANQGFAASTAGFLTRVFVSTDAVLGSDTLAGQYRFTGTLPPGQFFEQTLPVRLPQAAGDYWIIVQTDTENTVAEVAEDNNVAISAQPIHAHPAYRVSVECGLTTAPAGTPVPLYGRATNQLGNGVASKPVTLHILHNGSRRLITALTDAAGNYATTWIPLPGEAGFYEVGADHPGAGTTPMQDSFTLLGMRASVTTIRHQLSGLGSVSGTFELQNLSGLPLHSLTISAPTTPNVSATVTGPSELAGDASAVVHYEVTSLEDASALVQFGIRFTTDEGARLEVPVELLIEARHPRLVVQPTAVRLGLVRGEQRFVELEVVNAGALASSPVLLSLPAVPWIQAASASQLPPLAPGETNRFILQLLPSADVAIGEYNGNLGLAIEGQFVVVPFHFKVVSDARGDLTITTVDERTYYGEARANLADTTVTLRDPFNGAEVARGITDANGRVTFTNLLEGTYNFEATAPKHDTTTGIVTVQPGMLGEETIFLRTQLVTYRWVVEEIEIEDRTRITLETTFETFVPTPVVTVSPNVIDLSTIEGDEAQVNLTIENHGLVAANDVRLFFGSHPEWTLTPLISDLGVLPARSQLTVPLLIRRTVGPDGAPSVQAGTADVCTIPARLDWRLICGPMGIMYHVPIFVAGASVDCGGGTGTGAYTPPMWGDPTTSGGGGGSSDGGRGGVVTFWPTPPTHAPTNNCACDEASFAESCFSGSAGFKVDMFKELLKGLNVPLAAYGLKIDSISWSLTGSGQLCTCCENGVQGLKAKWGMGAGIEGTVILGFSPDFGITYEMPGVGEVEAEAKFIAGVVFSLSGSLQATGETDCFFENPQYCYTGSLRLGVSPQISGSVTLTLKTPDGAEYGGGGEAIAAVQTGFSVNIQWCNGDPQAQIYGEMEDIVFTAGISGEIKKGDTDAFIATGYTYTKTLVPGGRIPAASPGEASAASLFAEVSAAGDSAIPGTSADDWLADPLAPWLATSAPASIDSPTVAPSAPWPMPEFTLAAVRPTARRRVEYAALPPRPTAPAEVPAATGDGWVRAASDDGVCAQVRLRIEQEAVFTRKAVGATLEIFNHSDTLALEDLSVAISIYDEQGRLANDKFTILPPELSSIVLVSTNAPLTTDDYPLLRELWWMPPVTTGKARWVILPKDEATTGSEPVVYHVGGMMSYTAGGVPSVARLLPGPVRVFPNARLRLRYFHDRDVFSDDPFTDVIEPSVPFSLAVLVENVGRGVARNFRITSAQPKIVDNEKGLLIDFQIIASEVAGQNTTPSLTMDFGDVGPASTVLGRWLLTSTLQGLFVDYQATFEHEDSLGGRATSLIEEVTIHEMIRLVHAGGPFADGRPDFLVNDIPDPDDRPDTLWLSDGTTQPVTAVEQATVDAPPGAGHLQVQLTAPLPAGWVYLRVPEPGNGQFILRRIVRADGQEIALGTNAWTTDRTFIGLGRRPLRENILHLLDYNSPAQYTLHYEPLPAPDTTPPESLVAPLPAASREAFSVQWSGTDDSGEVAGYDVFVSVNGSPFVPWLQRTKLTTAVFQGEFGAQYAFYSLAVDAAGNRETPPLAPEAVTTVSLVNHPPVITPPSDQVIDEGTEFDLAPVVTDADLPADRLTFSLLSAPPGLTINPVTGQMRWVTGEAHGPSTNSITWAVRDDGLPSKGATNTFTLVVREVNTPPVLAPLTNATVLEGRWLILTNTATDADLPPQRLTWSLIGAPPGATIDPVSGVFRWRPSETQGGVTNAITVVVRDDGPGQLTATQTFLVTVVDVLSDFAVTVGTTNLLAGESSFVPLGLVAGVPLTNVTFTLAVDEASLTNLVLQPSVAGLSSSSLERVASNLFRLVFTTQPNAGLQGTQTLARLTFATRAENNSAIVGLRTAQVTGIGADGTVYDNGAGGWGRVFVIGEQPILADLERSASSVTLTLYGWPGQTYRVDSAGALTGALWREERTVTLNTTSRRLEALSATEGVRFYRAVQVPGAGALTIYAAAGEQIIEWPVTRPNCVLEEASTLGAGGTWVPATGVTVEVINGVARARLTASPGPKFYRLRCD
ncbi:MAG TPA: CARDB domain-containing protein [Verrucomicrobiota bacterium]|nr:CARDB domain-containing protein [Verrucomicrobiota bacterium]HQB15905.1 CARDB domain-containing protein [Verrucomicrobiota bacterium]